MVISHLGESSIGSRVWQSGTCTLQFPVLCLPHARKCLHIRNLHSYICMFMCIYSYTYVHINICIRRHIHLYAHVNASPKFHMAPAWARPKRGLERLAPPSKPLLPAKAWSEGATCASDALSLITGVSLTHLETCGTKVGSRTILAKSMEACANSRQHHAVPTVALQS